ncbi:MAG: 2TM domain-containing protein [Thermoleophilia bacterium]|nr:2TM domain-containing protein [Thermoleophilia bacterium]
MTTGLVVLNVLLVAYTEASFYWFPFPLVGWGIGLAMHYLFGVRRADIEIRATRARIERLARAA